MIARLLAPYLLTTSQKVAKLMTRSKKPQMQGVQILRNEAYLHVRRSDEGCSATPQVGFLRARHLLRDAGHEAFMRRDVAVRPWFAV